MTDESKKHVSDVVAELADRYGLTPQIIANIVVAVTAAQRAEEEQGQARSDSVNIMVAIETLDPQHHGITARGIVERFFPPREPNEARPQDEFEDARDAIENVTRGLPGRQPDVLRLAKYLAKNRGRILLGHKLERATAGGDATLRWTVTPAATTTSVSLF